MKQKSRTGIFSRVNFTILELLIVIGIFMILLSLLLPALKKAREKAHAARCLMNMKQLMLAQNSYAADNADNMVHSVIYGTKYENYATLLTRSGSMSGQLSQGGGYITWKSIGCPSVTSDRTFLTPGGGYKNGNTALFSVYGTYIGYNSEDLSKPGIVRQIKLLGDFVYASSASSWATRTFVMGKMRQPSQTAIAGDSASAHLSNAMFFNVQGCSFSTIGTAQSSYRMAIVRRHGNLANIGYADGHASPRSGDQLRRGAMPFTGGTYNRNLQLDHMETE